MMMTYVIMQSGVEQTLAVVAAYSPPSWLQQCVHAPASFANKRDVESTIRYGVEVTESTM